MSRTVVVVEVVMVVVVRTEIILYPICQLSNNLFCPTNLKATVQGIEGAYARSPLRR